ncbi:MAG: HEAT repeat domain-containing protein [Mastigocoleus sp. MO_167.B18]|uniref:HEAT repeat domain-containing protein n=1 Tax=Mastigocoleus sp. MO_188.B34 TaxID=3036635 RepID=UPI00262C472D|nr:HEAT repeat domain-containing protein [Mastigocoleus sp. MO_188.B34]MDJ0694212.1 HEAT repeat domain-containing protein [Mastigocoleus sp. MO_188.B34]MDJ0774068.1 HEAT repeat domain-containing protein [Mastigocoleus sp. MO_167.B18]
MEQAKNSQNTLEFLVFSVEEQAHALDLNSSKNRYERQAAASNLGYIVAWIIENKYTTAFLELLKAVESLIHAMRNDYMKPVRDRAREIGGTIYYSLIEYHSEEGSDLRLTNILKKLRRALILAGADLSDEKKEELTEKDPAILIQIINDLEDIDIREPAIEKLGNLKAQEAIGLLVDLLINTAENPDIRASAAFALSKIVTPKLKECELNKYEQIIAALIQALKYNEPIENDNFVRLQAAIALGKLIPPEAVDALQKAIKQDKFSNVREAAKDALKNYIRTSKTSIRDKIRVFGYLQLAYPEDTKKLSKENFPEFDLIKKLNPVQNTNFDRMSVNELIKSLKYESNTDRCVAIAQTLGRIGDSRALKPLIEKLKALEHDWIARKYVIQALGELNISSDLLDDTQLVQDILVEYLRNDIISDVRDAVEKTLFKIYKKNNYKGAEEALHKYSSDRFILTNKIIKQREYYSPKSFMADIETTGSKKINLMAPREYSNDYLTEFTREINQSETNEKDTQPNKHVVKLNKTSVINANILLALISFLLSILSLSLGIYFSGNKNFLVWFFIIFSLGTNIFLGLLLVFLLGIIIGNDKIREVFKQLYQ